MDEELLEEDNNDGKCCMCGRPLDDPLTRYCEDCECFG